MPSLYADEDFDSGVVVELRLLGYDVLTVAEAGKQTSPDRRVLLDAIQMGRAVLTFNRRHFFRLHRQIRPHSGIITCTRDPDAAALAARIHTAIGSRATLDNELVRIIRPSKP